MSQTSEKVKALHGQLMQSVEKVRSSEEWQEMLSFASKFHRYSVNNLLLISLQRPNATNVAGYRTWQGMGRQVRKGEKGIKIFAPMIKHDKDLDKKVLIGFRVVSVFDVSQTDGDPLPVLEAEEVTGEAPATVWHALVGLAEERGFTVAEADPGLDGAKGVTNHREKAIKVRPGMSSGQMAKTLCHEVAHMLMHGDQLPEGFTRDRVEVEAESVAFIVLNVLGVSTDEYSFTYVAAWSEGKPETVLQSADRVTKTAQKILRDGFKL